MVVFYFFAAIVIGLGLLSLRSGIHFHTYVKTETGRTRTPFTPFLSIIVPCRGLDERLTENIASLFVQDYPNYELVFVTDRNDDPSLKPIRELIEQTHQPHVTARVVIAGKAVDQGQKVHNLTVAVSRIDSRSEVIVFVDTDGRPLSSWLASSIT